MLLGKRGRVGKGAEICGEGLTFPANAMHLETNRPVLAIRVVIIPNLHASIKLTRSSIFSLSWGSSTFFALYGSAGLLPVSALLNDILDDGVFGNGLTVGVVDIEKVRDTVVRALEAIGLSNGLQREGNDVY